MSGEKVFSWVSGQKSKSADCFSASLMKQVFASTSDSWLFTDKQNNLDKNIYTQRKFKIVM